MTSHPEIRKFVNHIHYYGKGIPITTEIQVK